MTPSSGAPGIERRRMTLLTRIPLRGEARASSEVTSRGGDPHLTPRQRQVLDGLIRGLANKEIAAELGIGPDAVKRVISRLLIKLDAPSRTALIRPALQSDAARRRGSRAPSALSLLDAVPIPAVVTRGSTHRVEYTNPAAKAILADAGPALELADLLPPGPRRAITHIADESFRAGAPRTSRGVALHDISQFGTSWRRVDIFTSPIHDGAGKLAGLVIFLVDVSNEPTSREAAAKTTELSKRERERPA
jgi:DNA-binding CsgD family transcriptional regulator